MLKRCEKYQEGLKQIPAPGKGCHPFLLAVANRGVRAGLEDAVIVEDILQNIPQGRREVPRREIEQAVERARADFEKPRGLPPPKREPGFGWALTARLVGQYDGRGLDDLRALSPLAVPQEPAAQFHLALTRLYAPTDWLFIGPAQAYAVRDVNLKPAVAWLELASRSGRVPAEHLMLNALTGNAGKTLDGKDSFRCGEAVAEPPHYLLVEFDGMSEERQAAFWFGVITEGLMDVAALVHSGGKSIHSWVRVPEAVTDKVRWRAYVVLLFDRWLSPREAGVPVELRADRACRDAGRLTRCPGWLRADRGNRLQELLYLGPKSGAGHDTHGDFGPPAPQSGPDQAEPDQGQAGFVELKNDIGGGL